MGSKAQVKRAAIGIEETEAPAVRNAHPIEPDDGAASIGDASRVRSRYPLL